MKNQYLLAPIALLVPFLCSSCRSSGSGSDGYSTILLKEYRYVPARLSSGTEIEILGFSGGKDGRKGDVYYSQFIGKEKGSGDTVRILAAWIGVPPATGEGDGPVLTPAAMFDGKKGIREATFLIPDNNQLTTIKLGNSIVDAEAAGDTAKLNKAVADTSAPTTDYVILQNDVPLFKGSYKTAVGIMNFRQQPW
ncbi:hypothetical protein Q4E93_06235 [Flavitalea sp. BT771]|uniref:hypothetical protein n=1 Tax=Flavitalea sp. BT771 TaxID=3063329 RepID=UPI0026E26C8A|nr:hypothetical protein [Flavitalea sp. BT771]MDO6430174.1 hypothetical protein [Flavitalea sp. BT771]MDV6219687.1 hypothetical protein [Flavitalea sp. BT771]